MINVKRSFAEEGLRCAVEGARQDKAMRRRKRTSSAVTHSLAPAHCLL
jgi:hypothetical protein